MDVFTNVLEGARQYFQGLPAAGANASAAGPYYSQESAHQNEPNPNNMPPSSTSYWPSSQPEPNRPPTREHTPIQRPSSHSSDGSRTPSHSQYMHNVPQDHNRQYHGGGSYQDHLPTSQSQSFHFPQPQSRDAHSNHQYQSQHILTGSSYHQPHSPQLPRVPSREPMMQPNQNYQPPQSQPQQTYQPSQSQQSYQSRQSQQSYQATQSQQSYHQDYQQQRSYYPVQPQTKVNPSNNYKTSPSYPTSQNSYYKHIYSSQEQTSQQNNAYFSSRPTTTHAEINQQNQNTHQNNENSEQSFRTTHNLPPIAALSNYHSSRSAREPTRTVNSNVPRTRVLSSGSFTASTSQNNTVTSNSSLIQQNPNLTKALPYSTANYHQNYSYGNQQQQPSQQPPQQTQQQQLQQQTQKHHQQVQLPPQHYSYSTTATTQSYNNVIMTTSNTSTYYAPTNHSQSSSQSYFNQTVKPDPQNVQINQTSSNHQLPIHTSTIVDPNISDRLAPATKQKRESPLDLSLKTVKTPADSTLEETEANNKYLQNIPSTYSSISNHNYPTLDVQSIQMNLTRRSSQLPSATAPKVEFHPNFNVPSLSHQSRLPPKRVEEPRRNNVPEKAHSSNVRPEYKNMPYRGTSGRCPTGSVPSAAHVNSYIHQVAAKNNMARREFPAPTQNSLYAYQTQEHQKKRSSDAPLPAVPTKIPKVETWRESIDLQIEQKLSNYKLQQQHKLGVTTSKSSVVNGNYSSLTHERPKEMYAGYQNQNYENLVQPAPYPTVSPYQTNHSQTYVPSPATYQYPPSYLSRSHSKTVHNKSNVGAVDKNVLNLLRNSLEVRGQKKLEQIKSHENVTHHPRPDVQHPNTDVTAPLQPKSGSICRNNVSPFTPTSFPDNSMSSMYKFHLPKAMESVNIEKQIDTTVISNHTGTNSEYDGLAAYLAARIRTKGELKQVGSSQNSNNNSSTDVKLQGFIENQLKSPSPIKQEIQIVSSGTSTTTASVSPPKLLKERQGSSAPRKRLFSRNEEDPGFTNVPPRDKSGLRSSSETSVFDFPDSDSENEMPVLERQSLEAMRRDRKSYVKLSVTPVNSIDIKDVKIESPRPVSPEDDIFAQLCDNFVEQLKNGPKKKPTRRKKGVEPEVLAKLESVVTENPLDANVKVKIEIEDKAEEVANIKTEDVPQEIKINSNIEVPVLNNNREVPVVNEIKKESSDLPSSPESKIQNKSDIKSQTDSESKNKKDPVFIKNKRQVRRRLVSSSDSSDSENEFKKVNQNCISPEEKINTEIKNNNGDVAVTPPEEASIDKVKSETESPTGPKEILPIVRPAKKPSFGNGSDFYPGWEEGVYKYKKSLRMPPSLIQVTRPPASMRLSTSLPDLDPCPHSPTASIPTDSENKDPPSTRKKTIKKIRSEPIDSDSESTSSFNLFSKKTNYDSEGSSSIKSLPNTKKENLSILDKLLEKYGAKKRRKHKRKDDLSPKVIPKAENPVELLPTPSLDVSKVKSIQQLKKLKTPVIEAKSALLGFRKDTIKNFKDAFINSSNNILGVHDKFATVVLKSRTRKQTRVLKQRATIKEVFGEDRPASAPPVTCLNDIQIREEVQDEEKQNIFSMSLQNVIIKKEVVEEPKKHNEQDEDEEIKQALKNNLLNREKNKERNNRLKALADKKIKTEIEYEDAEDDSKLTELVIKKDPKSKSATPSLDGDECSVSGKKRGKFGKMRRKFSSGFDYIRKKKKVKKDNIENDSGEKKKRKGVITKAPESVDDIQKEIKTWVLNKGIGESHLHRAARLGYTDITAYCLEKMDCHPTPKDNAGYTPLHEACSRGHLDIAKLLLKYGANVHESAQGGIRPLHEAVENGFIEIVRLLLSYGADPTLATYAGITPLSLTNDEDTKKLLRNHLNDRQGEAGSPWNFYGPASCFDHVEEIGYNILDSPPEPDPAVVDEDFQFEMSETLLPNLYTLHGEPSTDRWVLLQDLSNLLKIKSRDALLRQICTPSTSSSTLNYKSVLRELKMTDFLEQARCCQFLNQGEKINTRASKIALVKYTDKVKELLGIENVSITDR